MDFEEKMTEGMDSAAAAGEQDAATTMDKINAFVDEERRRQS